MNGNISIRKAKSDDVPAIVGLMREFAEFEKLSQFLEINEENLREVLFGEDAFVHGMVAVDGENLAAYAIFYPHFSSFRGQKSVYLEDIYISEMYRKSGLGEMLIKEIAKTGREFGAVRMDFQVLNWNAPAIGFYKKHGASVNDEERHFCFTDDAFLKLTT